jgi:hypothetical protein
MLNENPGINIDDNVQVEHPIIKNYSKSVPFLGHHHQITINSKNRSGGTSSNFTYRINLPIRKNLKYVAVKEIQIPATFYGLDDIDNENQFQLIEGVTVFNHILERGNYTAADLVTVLNAILSLFTTNAYTVTYSSVTARFTISAIGSENTIILRIPSIRLAELLGMNVGDNVFITQKLVSPNASTQAVEQSIRIISNICGDDEELASMIDLKISNGMIAWSSQDVKIDRRIMLIGNSNEFYFRLVNEDNRALDTNGVDMSIILYFF